MTERRKGLPPVFVLGHPKSGTSLLQALLDGHPELFVLPAELKFFKFPRIPSLPPGNMPPPPLPSWHTPIPRDEVSLEALREEMLDHAELRDLLRTGEVGRGITVTEEMFDSRRFLESLGEASPEDLRGLYLSFCESILAATLVEMGQGSSRFVEKSPHLEEYAAELRSWFPDAQFLHVMRNPYASLNSILSSERLKRSLRNRRLRPMAKSFYFMERNRRYLGGYRIVRFEDVVLKTEPTMRSIADFLGISFRETLTEPTVLGRPWYGNPRSVEGRFEGIDPRPVDAFEGQIHPLLVALVNRFFGPLLEEYDYEREPVGPLAPWRPMRWETPWHYWRNRELLWSSTL